MRRFIRFSSSPIRYRVVAALFVVVFLSAISISYFTFKQFESSMIHQAVEHMADIRNNRIHDIRTSIQKSIRDNERFSTLPAVIKDLSNHNPAEYSETVSNSPIHNAIDQQGEYYDLHDLFIISTNGNIIHSMGNEVDARTNLLSGPYKETQLAKVFRQAMQMLQPQISTVAYYEPSSEAALFIATPVIHDNKILGVTAVQINWEELHDTLTSITGLGESGEVVAGILKQDKAYLAPLRHMPSAELDLEVTMGSSLAGPIQYALQGDVGSAFDKDYRDIDVAAAWGYIPELQMGIVVKMDTEELLEPVEQMKSITLIIVAGILLIAVFIAYLLARSITAPLARLTDSTLRYAEGDISVRSTFRSGDEIGQLATAFNVMADHLEEYNREIRTKNLALIKAGEVLEQKVCERTATLAAANEEIKSFAYIVSHDLRSPLVNMKGFTGELEYTLKEISELTERIEEKLEQRDRKTMHRLIQEDIPESFSFISTSVAKMDHMLTAILTLSRLGRRELHIESIDLKPLCDEILATLTHQIKQTGTTVELNTLPVIDNDRIVIEQIMNNLIGNAIKYLALDRAGNISINAESDDNGITINVTDNGRGISEEENDKVFQIFRRGKHQDVQGEGMGLAYVQTLARAQNGSITFESEENVGSTFSVFLPLNSNFSNKPEV